MPAEQVRSPAAPPAPGSTASLRAANQRRVIALLQEEPSSSPVTQAEIARATGLAPATVSNIVRDLAAVGMVETTTGSGRRGTTVRISRSAGLVVGVDFGHRHVRVAVGDLAGEVVVEERERIAFDHSYREGLDRVETILDALLAGLSANREDVLNVGLGLPAPITEDDVVMPSAILPGWVGVNARAEASSRLGRPVHIDNDANLGALAEYRHGAGQGHSNMVFVKVSSGVGAGLILGGRLFRGTNGTAGEIGHLTIDEQGPFCRCGSRGCLETYASIEMAQEMLAGQLPDASIDDIVAAAKGGNVSALRMFEDAGLHLGWALAMVANLINPSAVVVGGDMSRAGDLLLDSVRVGMRRHALASVTSTTLVTTARLGERASVIGAMLLALDRTELVPAHGVG
jgi:glucokinase-like ROK family protein